MPGAKPRKQANTPEFISFGYVIIPMNVDRDLYVQMCMRTCRVCIMEDGGIFRRDVYITNEALVHIEFPKTNGERGTAVVLANNPYYGTPIIIGTYPRNDQSVDWSEDIYRFRKRTATTDASMSIDPINNLVIVEINSQEAAEVIVRASGSEEVAVKIESSGSVDVKADKNVSVTGYTQIEAQIVNVEKPDEEERKVLMNLDTFSISRKNENITESVAMDDTGVTLTTKENMTIKITDSELNIKTGNSTLVMNNDKINFNGGGLAGLMKIDAFTTKLNNLVTQVNNFITLFNTHQHTVQVAVPAGTGSTVALSTPTGQPTTSFSKGDYENTKIVQG